MEAQSAQKLHQGVTQLQAETPYNMGFFKIDFEDQPIVFYVFASFWGERGPELDALSLTFEAENRGFFAWLLQDGTLLDKTGKPLQAELETIAREIVDSKKFRGRYRQFLYLVRKFVLQGIGRYEHPFEHKIHCQRLGLNPKDLEQGIVGRVTLPNKIKAPYFIAFCEDPKCYCENLILELTLPDGVAAYQITPKNEWSFVRDPPTLEEEKYFNPVKKKLKREASFSKTARYLRMERKLHNFFRFCKEYEQENML